MRIHVWSYHDGNQINDVDQLPLLAEDKGTLITFTEIFPRTSGQSGNVHLSTIRKIQINNHNLQC